MADDGLRIFPLGTDAVTVEFGTVISPDLNERSLALAEYFDAHPFDGYLEAVPCYASTTIFFDRSRVRDVTRDGSTAFDLVKAKIETALAYLPVEKRRSDRTIEIPAIFSGSDAPDLAFVASEAGMNEDDVVKIFTTTLYRVYMIGFLPGFAYMGTVDERLAISRKTSPRTRVRAGSIGIAGRQTGIYPLDSPGGWQIVGRTETAMFDPSKNDPCFLHPGDLVRFIAK